MGLKEKFWAELNIELILTFFFWPKFYPKEKLSWLNSIFFAEPLITGRGKILENTRRGKILAKRKVQLNILCRTTGTCRATPSSGDTTTKLSHWETEKGFSSTSMSIIIFHRHPCQLWTLSYTTTKIVSRKRKSLFINIHVNHLYPTQQQSLFSVKWRYPHHATCQHQFQFRP